MKDYSDYLICTDYDGTLSCDGVPQNNIDAIIKFMDQGGRFTLCTGRGGEGFVKQSPLPFILNAPMIGLTGAQIYDTAADRLIEANFMDGNWHEIVRDLAENIDCDQTFEIVGKNNCYRFHAAKLSQLDRIIKEASDDSIYKVVGFNSYPGPDPLVPGLLEICHGRCNATSNGRNSYELTALNINKGYGAGRVKELTGAKILVCVGDFVGDISMFQEADVSFAVANAIDELKEIADHVTVHARDGALAAIIDQL